VECKEDGRGAWVVITPAGRTAIEKAAPGHVESVRRLVFDALDDAEVETFTTLVDKLQAQVDAAGRTTS
jgi:DNA-binding MarR family transcriptional regulator